jgi:hypothetical protein
MLSLVRSAGTPTRSHLLRSRIQNLRPTARYVSDTGLGGFGALSVPIPLKSTNEIRLGQTAKSKPKHKAEDGLRPSNGSTTGGKGRRRREHLARLAAKAKDHEKSEKAKGDDAAERQIKSHQVEWKEEKKGKSATKTRGRKADVRVRRAGKAKPIIHHTYGMSKEPKGSGGASAVENAGEATTTGDKIKETDFAPEEIESTFST